MMISILSLVLCIASIFIGQTKGVMLYILGTLGIWFMWGAPSLGNINQGPLIVAGILLMLFSIMIGRWYGLLVWLLGSFLLIGVIAMHLTIG